MSYLLNHLQNYDLPLSSKARISFMMMKNVACIFEHLLMIVKPTKEGF